VGLVALVAVVLVDLEGIRVDLVPEAVTQAAIRARASAGDRAMVVGEGLVGEELGGVDRVGEGQVGWGGLKTRSAVSHLPITSQLAVGLDDLPFGGR